MGIPTYRQIDPSAIRWVLVSRAIVGTIFMAAALSLKWTGLGSVITFSPAPVSIYAFAVYLSSLVLGIIALVKSPWAGVAFTYGLTTFDLLLTTWLVAYTGGSSSPFLFLYLLTIVATAMLSFRRGAVVTAAASMALLGAILVVDYYHKLPTIYLHRMVKAERNDLLVTAFYNILAFYVVGLLSGYLSDRLRRAGEELDRRDIDISILRGLQERIIDNVASGILTLDEDGRILLANRQAEKILGIAASRLQRMSIHDVLPGIQLTMSGGIEGRSELSYQTPDGSHRSLGYSVSSLRFDQNRVGSIVVFQDLTRMKELERALVRQERLAAVGAMAAGLAHEIRNPLGSISGSLQLLQHSALPEDSEERQLLGIALREINRLNGLITNFLYYARPFRREPERFVPRVVFDEIVQALRVAPSTPESVCFVNEADPKFTLVTDPHAFRQVLLNLLTNAVQAGARRIVFRTRTQQDGVRVEVEDDGHGIPPEIMKRLFEPFFTTRADGVGLGLAIVYRVMEEAGGSVQVQSKPGCTVFSLHVPEPASVQG